MGDASSISNEQMGESPAVEITGKIMVVAIVILFMVVVFCLILHLYAKLFIEPIDSQSRRRRRRLVFAPGQEQPLRRGLDPLVLKSLPVLMFQSSQEEEFKDGLECAVCLCEVAEGEKVRLLPKCNHGFHVDCIDMWFQSHSTCPLCRNPVGSSESESCSSGALQNATENGEEGSSSEAEAAAENSPTFPTNVFIFGNQAQVSSIGGALSEEATTTTTTTTATMTTSRNRHNGMLVIDIPNERISSSLSPSASRFAEDDLKSPMSARLRSLKRLLSRDRRLNPWSPRSPIDVEQGGGTQQS
ncbi:hypothetical protein RIF29_23962 [Crotalaria pallida]|uniref:RING-type E3 ubiquitin transferase n=1 Tax=Crotalaria pallida TaxID=3830 RepID=A0AAN9EJG5_CROPI